MDTIATKTAAASAASKPSKPTVASVNDCLIQGYPERHVTMSNGHRWCFRFANDRIHLMTGPGRVRDYPSEYRVARQRTIGFRPYIATNATTTV